MKTAVLFALLGLVLNAAPLSPRASVSSDRSLRAVTVAHGIKLTLIVPHRVYPRNALVRVTVHVRNVSRHIILVPRPCRGENPWVEAVTNSGAVVYPPALPYPASVVTACKSRFALRLSPGRVLTAHVLVILRARHLRAAVCWAAGYTCGPGVPDMHGPEATVELVAGHRPRVMLTTSPAVSATLLPASPARGLLYYMDALTCPGSIVGLHLESPFWSWAPSDHRSRTVAPEECHRPVEWHAVAGWIDQPVAYVDYRAR